MKSKTKSENAKLTLREIAAELGMSKATVSLAINNSPLVAAKTRERVLQKIEELGYVYNRRAASLTTGESRTVGLAVHDITNPYFTAICAAIESVLSTGGRMSFLCNTGESIERQAKFVGALIEHNADGLILCPAAGTSVESLQPLIKRKLPTVLFTRNVVGSGLDFVGNNEVAALRLVTAHLIGLGHRRIAILGGNQLALAAQQRRDGFFAAMADAGLSVAPELVVDCDNNPGAGADAARSLLALEQPPSAIVGYSDQVALGAMSGLLEAGVTPGRDIAVVGCDDIEEGARSYIQLTTVRVQKTAIGQAAAEMLLRRLTDPDHPAEYQLFEPELVVRRSCGGPFAG
ncbi:hypothetical protein A8C75_15935 [Marinobacterium aestuarii]|uniref:HTH lacI-type domain-containing protein n=1 Tax=Marinobacterium aestuarii TaxID=1821621 RepID=A0A1A9F1R5_9GAMM|nr:LacI family DNA-binding transcriptional regulator [Marinobacterium aestuarii]ANG63818.1 hypothetical protein A8C75_15935 [Marinobacterium aestuarii]